MLLRRLTYIRAGRKTFVHPANDLFLLASESVQVGAVTEDSAACAVMPTFTKII